jgi:UDP-glucose 4-epimerase
MRILVTGGAGFIGSNIADAYRAEGHEVAVLDSLQTGSLDNVSADTKLYECDISDAAAVEHCFADFQPEVVSHHAAQLDVRKSMADPVYDAQINIAGSLNVLLAAVKNGVQRFIFASSGGAVYGEPEFMPVDETHPIAPASPYGVTKYAFEHYLRIWGDLHNFVPVVLRYANVYGPRQTPHAEGGVVAIFTQRLLRGETCTIFGDGTMTRDYVFVGDIVDANLRALACGQGVTVNIGTGVQTTTREVFDTIRDAIGDSSAEPEFKPERPGEVRFICLENTRAKELLGWTPHFDFRAGTAETLRWQQSLIKA